MTDRRKPLGGVTKDSFVHSWSNPEENAKLTYDLLNGLASDLCYKFSQTDKKVDDLKIDFENHPADCEGRFIKSFAKFRGLQLSLYNFLVLVLVFGVLIGLGVLEFTDVISVKQLVIP